MCNTKVGVLLYTGSETWLFSDGDWALQSQVRLCPVFQPLSLPSSQCVDALCHFRAPSLLVEAPRRSRRSARGRLCSAARELLGC